MNYAVQFEVICDTSHHRREEVMCPINKQLLWICDQFCKEFAESDEFHESRVQSANENMPN